MTVLLHVEASPRGARSHSSVVAGAFIEAWQRHRPEGVVETLDLWNLEEPLIEFDGDALTAKYASRDASRALTEGERTAWAEVTRQAERLKRADLLLLSVPMWNYGVPYRFKHWVDVVTQPGITFRPDPVKGPQGLLAVRKALLVSARGGVYAPGTPRAELDGVTDYVRRWLGLVGVRDLSVIGVDGMALPTAAQSQALAVQQAQALAPSF